MQNKLSPTRNAMHSITQVMPDGVPRTMTRHQPRYRRARIALLSRMVSVGLGCLATAGCGSDSTGPAPQDLATAYWALHLNHHAITMALPNPYNTVQLTAAPLTLVGGAVPGAGRASYSTYDSTIAVDSLGRLTARYATLGQPAQVIASLTANGVTLSDTAYVQVDSFPLVQSVTTFSIHPRGTTCRQSAYDSPFSLPVYAIDAVGDTLHSGAVGKVLVYYMSSDPTIASIDRSYGRVSGYGPGTVTLTATALIDGVAQRDTLNYIFGPSHTVRITANVQHGASGVESSLTFTPATVTVGAGWHVNFVNPTVDSVDVVFTDSIRGVNGNIVGYYSVSDTTHTGPIYPGALGEVFFDAGVYAYHSERFGQGGTVRVQCGYEGS